jgi:hypothetical protein
MEASILQLFPQFTREYVRDGVSYANLLLLQLSRPPYRGVEDKGGKRKVERVDKFKHANQLFESF